MSLTRGSSPTGRDVSGENRLIAGDDTFDDGWLETIAAPLPMTPLERSADPAIISSGEANRLGGGESISFT
jgi:hypothetical protein